MGQLLGRRVIHLAVIGVGDRAGGFALWRKGDLKIDIIKHRAGVAQMWQQLKIALRRVTSERL